MTNEYMYGVRVTITDEFPIPKGVGESMDKHVREQQVKQAVVDFYTRIIGEMQGGNNILMVEVNER